MEQIVISAVISSVISLLIVNHEAVRDTTEDIHDRVKHRFGKMCKDKSRDNGK